MHYGGGAGEHVDVGEKFPLHLLLAVLHNPEQQRQLTPPAQGPAVPPSALFRMHAAVGCLVGVLVGFLLGL